MIFCWHFEPSAGATRRKQIYTKIIFKLCQSGWVKKVFFMLLGVFSPTACQWNILMGTYVTQIFNSIYSNRPAVWVKTMPRTVIEFVSILQLHTLIRDFAVRGLWHTVKCIFVTDSNVFRTAVVWEPMHFNLKFMKKSRENYLRSEWKILENQ